MVSRVGRGLWRAGVQGLQGPSGLSLVGTVLVPWSAPLPSFQAPRVHCLSVCSVQGRDAGPRAAPRGVGVSRLPGVETAPLHLTETCRKAGSLEPYPVVEARFGALLGLPEATRRAAAGPVPTESGSQLCGRRCGRRDTRRPPRRCPAYDPGKGVAGGLPPALGAQTL